MKDVPVASVRNFAILGHSGCGKTTLADALLFKLGATDRLGAVDSGSSVADWTDAEKNRKITIQAKPFNAVYKSKRTNSSSLMAFCDTPGYMDFYGQVIAATSVSDSALIVLDAHSGVQIGATKAWSRVNELNLPRAIVVSGLDRDNADYAGVVKEVREKWGAKCVPFTIPNDDGKTVRDILATKDAPERGSIIEIAAESNDALLEKYLGGEELTQQEIVTGIRAAVNACKLVPIFACAPQKDVGIVELLEGMVASMPSPADRPAADAAGTALKVAADSPFVGFVWRTVNDAFVGQLSFVRIYSGTLKSDTEALNAVQGEKERIAGILCVNGKQQTTLTEAGPGEIIALSKLKKTKLNDTLCATSQKVVCKPIKFPSALLSYAVRGKTRADDDKIGPALARIAEDDPTIHVERNVETTELCLSGLGDVHLETAMEHMKARSGVEVVLSPPRIPYRETVTAVGDGHHKHKKQTGGRGQFGEVYMKIMPRKAGDEEWFVNDTFGGSIPHNFIPAIQKGVVEGMARGAVAGYHVTDVKVSVYDGSYHEVDSSEISFKIAGARAFRDAMTKARPVLLEPIMTVKVFIPDRYMGDVNGDLSHKRGRILGVETDGGVQVITADVPRAELQKYCAELRSMTQGQGTFEMALARYDIVPSNIAQKIIAEAAKDKKEEEE